MHDANFVDNRLRLAAFLRVVKQGMPPRPSRFKRRIQVPDEQSASLVTAAISQIDQVLPATEADHDPSTRDSACLDVASATAAVDVGYFGDDETGYRVQPISIYHIPLSRTPTVTRPTPANDDDQEVQQSQSPVQRQSYTTLSVKFRRKAGTAITTKAKKAPAKPRGSSNTRKRRLPVNELALLRTTTSDGLPPAGDADVAFATPITVVDPIEDSQAQNAFGAAWLNVQRPHNVITFKQGLSARTVQQPKGNSPAQGRITESPTRFLETHSRPFKILPQSRTGILSDPDGFVGRELRYTSRKRSGTQYKTAPTPKKKLNVVRELALGSGPLPISAVQEVDISIVQTEGSSHFGYLRTMSRPEDHQDSAKPGQLVLTKSQSSVRNEASSHRLPGQCNKAILHQLSSITAPLRRESGSSESSIVEEEGNTDFENGDGMDDADELDVAAAPNEE